MNLLTVRAEAMLGDDIRETLGAARQLAGRMNVAVAVEFNGRTLRVESTTDVAAMVLELVGEEAAGRADGPLPERNANGRKLPAAITEITAEALEALPDYSLSVPTGVFVGKRWKRNENFFHLTAGPLWVVGEYAPGEKDDECVIKWSRVRLILGPAGSAVAR